MANSRQNPATPAQTDVTKKPVKKKRKRARRKHPVIFTIFLVFFVLLISGIMTCLVVGSFMFRYVDGFVGGKKVIDLDYYKSTQSQTSILYAYNANGKPVEQTRLHGEENRIWIDYDEMPDDLIWAFVCLEDKRFFEHSGVDWRRTVGVMIKPSLDGQGGSTITQQLIKNLTKKNEVTYIRKFNEILRALNLENYYSKTDILEAYLNEVYLGCGCYGVRTAAERYFGKEVKDLTLVECATLAAITKAPYTQNPVYSYEKNREREQYCLECMKEQGKISEKRYNKAIKKKVKVLKNNTISSTGGAEQHILSWYEEYVIDQVIADLQAEYGYEYNEASRMVYYGGLNIYSAVDLGIQSKLEEIYRNREGFPYSVKDKEGRLPQSAMTIMDYQGRIVAIAGGTGEKTANRSYNRATDKRAKRQPGSSIKPLGVYAPAMDLGLISPTSPILEKSITIQGKPWPRNFNGDHGSGNYISVQEALVRSLNTVPVRILSEMLGVNSAFEYANDHFHLNLSTNDKDLSPLAVGGTNTGVTTLEMAAAFATFGNGGKYYKPYSYYKVTDRNGEVLLDHTKDEPEQAIKLATSNSMRSMLTKAVTQSNGTGYGSQISRFQTFAKTGTTSDNCDKWYCGGTPHYVTAVWYGFDYRADLHTGTSNPAKTIFRYIFSKIHADLPQKTFTDVIEECGGAAKDATEMVKTDPVTTSATTTESTEPSEDDTTTTTEKPTAPTTAPTTAQPTAPPDGPQMAVDD
ncbi:MAG: transglycosylase domain-containing protein [Clostridia bacterium]|nr:transglycosylase domain-containing protein [Clostridia bacterium]